MSDARRRWTGWGEDAWTPDSRIDKCLTPQYFRHTLHPHLFDFDHVHHIRNGYAHGRPTKLSCLGRRTYNLSTQSRRNNLRRWSSPAIVYPTHQPNPKPHPTSHPRTSTPCRSISRARARPTSRQRQHSVSTGTTPVFRRCFPLPSMQCQRPIRCRPRPTWSPHWYRLAASL